MALQDNQPGATDYASTVTPEGYVCGVCGASGVKLWRRYQTFLNHQELTCAVCSAKAEGKNIEDIDADGKYTESIGNNNTTSRYRCDQIGWRVPAVPDEEGETYWGYTSVPPAGVAWWRRLTTLPTASSPNR
jgi:hypothetical protein